MEVRNQIKLTDEDKQLVLKRYSDIEWPDDATRMRCTLCQNIAIHTYVLNCRHLICSSCYVNRRPKECQRCGEDVTTLSLRDLETETKLCQLIVSCPNRKYGCQQVDELGNIVDHMRCCLHSKDTSITVEQTGTYTMEALYRLVSEQMRQLCAEMRVMKSESEANWKQMQAKMNELGQKVDNNMDQLNSDSHAQTKRLNNCDVTHKGEDVPPKQRQDKVDSMELKVDNTMEQLNGLASTLGGQKHEPTRSELKENVARRKTTQKLKHLRDEVEKLKSEQTRLSVKAKEDIETIYTVKGRADTFIQLLEQKDKKTKKKQKKIESGLKNVLDVHKEQLEDVKTKMASMDEEQKTNQTALGLLDNSIRELNKDLQEQHKQLRALEQHRKDAENRNREMEKVTTNPMEMPIKTQPFGFDDVFGVWASNQMTAVDNLPVAANPGRPPQNKTSKQKRQITPQYFGM